RTIHELRLAGVRTGEEPRPVSGEQRTPNDERRTDLFGLLARVEAELHRSSVDDRASLFRLAAAACRAGYVRWAQMPILLLDVPLDSRAEQELAAALIARSPDVLATVADGDEFALGALRSLGGIVEAPRTSDVVLRTSDLSCLRRYVFQT